VNPRAKLSLIVFCLSLGGTAALLNFHFRHAADSIKPADLYAVVYDQFNALRAEDYSLAYERASNDFQRKFDVAKFAELIRGDYARIARAERVEFGQVMCRGGHAMVHVFFIDTNGTVTPCFYSLLYEDEQWKISGARLMRRWPRDHRLNGLRS
jgi:hypothetical protein